MSKSNDLIADVLQNQKYHFKHTDNRPQKAQKHRYERRKVREVIRLGDWVGEQEA